MDELATTSDVIDALGGTAKVARLTQRSMQAVSNWRRGTFPPETYKLLRTALAERAADAPDVLWGMLPEAPAEAPAQDTAA